MECIDKSALVAEINRRIADNKKEIERASHKNLEDYFEGYEDALALLKQQYIDTLEVKDVDLNAAVEHYVEQHKSELNGYFDIRRIARHFFELGLKVQKGE